MFDYTLVREECELQKNNQFAHTYKKKFSVED